MQDKIMQDLKAAMLAKESDKVEVLRMVKTALQMAEIDESDDFNDDKQLKIIAKESKKRKEAAKMYADGGDQVRADKELAEAAIIDAYLPEQLSDEKVEQIVLEVIEQVNDKNMGAIIGQVMAKAGGKTDGGTVARIVKEKL